MLTMKGNTTFRSRCVCQAQLHERSRYTHRSPDERAMLWFAYDWLGQGTSDVAIAAFHKHLEGAQ